MCGFISKLSILVHLSVYVLQWQHHAAMVTVALSVSISVGKVLLPPPPLAEKLLLEQLSH